MHMTEKGMQFVSPLTHQAREVNVNPLEITRAYQLLLCYYHNILFALISGLLPYFTFSFLFVYSLYSPLGSHGHRDTNTKGVLES